MKKLLILAGVLAISISTQSIAAENISPNNPPKPPCNCAQAKRPDKPPFDKEKFEKRLKLTDAQKEQARIIREKGHEQMKPIMEKIKEKHEEINAVRLTKLTQQMKDEQINQLRKELRELKRGGKNVFTHPKIKSYIGRFKRASLSKQTKHYRDFFKRKRGRRTD